MAATEKETTLDGTRIDNFLIGRKLSAGGMGVVYEATDQDSGQRVAIKVLHADIAKHREVTLRFINEARAVNIVQHPNLVKILHLGRLANDSPYLAMEYLDGVSLGGRLRESGGRLPMPQAIEVCRQVADALAASHEKGIVHRDLKPDNVMLLADAGGRIVVKVFDFGIAKLPPEHMSADFTVLRTQTGQVLGTPSYMAPEQCLSNKPITDKVDVYALGTMLFRCLVGRTPFTTEARGDAGLMHLCALQIGEPPPPLGSLMPEAPEALRNLVDRTLAKEPAERPNMVEFRAELGRLLQSSSVIDAPHPAPASKFLAASARSHDAKTITRDSMVRRTKSVWRRRLPYLVAAVFGLVWLVVLAIWAIG